jgi:hypothetical protein
METRHLRLLRTVELPGKPLVKFDIGWVDEPTRRYYLADRSNARIAVLDVDSLEYVAGLGEGLFTGVPPVGGATAGPNGVLVLPDLQQAWAGDGDSTVKIIDVKSGELVASVNTGGVNRVDELAYDGSGSVLVANDQETVPFATLISTGADQRPSPAGLGSRDRAVLPARDRSRREQGDGRDRCHRPLGKAGRVPPGQRVPAGRACSRARRPALHRLLEERRGGGLQGPDADHGPEDRRRRVDDHGGRRLRRGLVQRG